MLADGAAAVVYAYAAAIDEANTVKAIERTEARGRETELDVMLTSVGDAWRQRQVMENAMPLRVGERIGASAMVVVRRRAS